MLVSLASQLINYGVAAVCLRHKEERLGSGLEEMSDEVTLFAAVVGFLLVGVQVAGVVYTYLDEKADEKHDDADEQLLKLCTVHLCKDRVNHIQLARVHLPVEICQ